MHPKFIRKIGFNKRKTTRIGVVIEHLNFWASRLQSAQRGETPTHGKVIKRSGREKVKYTKTKGE
jgi:hypothetical protein